MSARGIRSEMDRPVAHFLSAHADAGAAVVVRSAVPVTPLLVCGYSADAVRVGLFDSSDAGAKPLAQLCVAGSVAIPLRELGIWRHALILKPVETLKGTRRSFRLCLTYGAAA